MNEAEGNPEGLKTQTKLRERKEQGNTDNIIKSQTTNTTTQSQKSITSNTRKAKKSKLKSNSKF